MCKHFVHSNLMLLLNHKVITPQRCLGIWGMWERDNPLSPGLWQFPILGKFFEWSGNTSYSWGKLCLLYIPFSISNFSFLWLRAIQIWFRLLGGNVLHLHYKELWEMILPRSWKITNIVKKIPRFKCWF